MFYIFNQQWITENLVPFFQIANNRSNRNEISSLYNIFKRF